MGPIPGSPAATVESAPHADVAQLVERELPKLEVAGSRPVVRFLRSFAVAQVAPTATGSTPVARFSR